MSNSDFYFNDTLKSKYNSNEDIAIVLIHGLGAGPYALYPLKWYLAKYFSNTLIVIPKYDTSNIESNEVLLYRIDIELSKYISKTTPIIVIGQSLGGIIAMNLYEKKWNVLRSISSWFKIIT